MQLTEAELLHIGAQLSAEAIAIAKNDAFAEQATDTGLQQLYQGIANRHRSHYETILQNIQHMTSKSQL